MCGLFGFSVHGEDINNLGKLTNSLAERSEIRGSDATGIAYNNFCGLNISKENKPASKLTFRHSDSVKALIGHTRHSTQGDEKKNYNNHPFYGKCGKTRFALAHNGILANDRELRIKHKMPETKIETDSYIAVQLLENEKKLDFESIKKMAEQVEGSFSFSILDDKNNIYIVKGDSPISILHFTKLGIYVYASTDEILYRALIDSPLFDSLKKGEYEKVRIDDGEILKIRSDGKLERCEFDYSYYYGRGWWQYGSPSIGDYDEQYIEDIKQTARYYGYTPEDIDRLLAEGFLPEEIEDFLWCGEAEVMT